MRSWQSCFIALMLIVLSVGMARAQSNSEITGTVTDPSGAIVPRAQVTLVSPQTGQTRTTTSNSAGIFQFSGLDIGNYNLTVTESGFQTYVKKGIVVNVAESLKEDVPLAVGGSSQTVTVEANALQVQSESNQISSLITGQQISQLATNGRNVTALATLGTGVSGNLPSFNGVTAQGSTATISFNGMRPDHNNWLINGGEVYDRGSGGKLDVMPSPDFLSQFQVLSSNYTPDYGISSAGTISMELKSGTRSFHGGLWEFIRNDALDANYYFSKQSHQKSPELRLNIFGGYIGGPVVIPHLYNNSRQKTFFFWGEEWRKFVSGANPTSVNTIPANDFPTAGQNFAYTPVDGQKNTLAPDQNNANVIIVPNVPGNAAYTAKELAAGLTPGQPFPNNTIPASFLDPNAVLFMGTGAIPQANAANNQNIQSPKQPTDVREDIVRIDHNVTDRMHLLGSWIHDQMSQTVYPPMWGSDSYYTVGNTFKNPSWAAVIKLSQTISPTILNETSLNVNGNTIDMQPVGIYKQPAGWSQQTFFTGNNALNRLPQVKFTGTGPVNTTWGTNYWPWHNSFLNYQIRDDLSWVRGKHSLKFGFSFMRSDKNQQLQNDTQGDFTFSGATATGDSYTNFLLGLADGFTQLQTQRTAHWVNNTYSFYGNDDWHITSRLTLNIGLRYDLLPHVLEKNNLVANFVPSAFNPANAQKPSSTDGTLNPAGPGFAQPAGAPTAFYLNGMQLAGVNGVPRGLVQNQYNTLQPRIGFAYDAFGNGKTVVRGGFGQFYERVQGNDVYGAAGNVPYSYQPGANQVFYSNTNTSYTSGATASLPVTPTGPAALNSYYPNPATTQYSLGIQQELAPSVVFGLGYVGTSGWNQDDKREINDLGLSDITDRQAVATGKIGNAVVNNNANLYRPYAGYGNILLEENASNTSYNSLQAALRMESKHGLTLQFAYTWSHEIDILSGDLSNVSNPYDLKYDRGSGLYDRRHIFNANYVYELPFFLHSDNFLAREFVGGWQVAGVTTVQSGSPFANGGVTYNGPDVLGLGGNTTNRPNIVSGIKYPKTQLAWFSTSSFADPAAPWTAAGAGTTGFGNARKDAVIGPGLFNSNISLYKDIPLNREAMHLQFRAESFNTFNHTEFQNVDTGSQDKNFGQVTSTYDPRELQFGLKFLF